MKVQNDQIDTSESAVKVHYLYFEAKENELFSWYNF